MDVVGLVWAIYDGVVFNLIIIVVKEGFGVFQNSGVDYLIVIGGGFLQDICKVIGIISNNLEFVDVCSLEGFFSINKFSVSILVIFIIVGIVVEVIINYVIIDEEKWCKFVCVDLYDILQVVFIDVDMMDGMFLVLKVAMGVDVFIYVIEGYIICGVWVLIDVLYIKAIEIIVGVL